MPQKTQPAALPDGIEIFRAGKRTADSGEVYEITRADLAATVATYDPSVHEASLCVGHPASDLPAYGWVKSLATDSTGALTSSHKQVEPQFAEMVAAGRFKKRSASFYHPTDPSNPKPGVWYLRHVAFLGAQPPAVKGLKDIAFNEGDEARAINFSEPITPPTRPTKEKTMEPTQAELDAANELARKEKDARELAEKEAKGFKDQLAQFNETARVERHAAHVSFAEAQLKVGRILPQQKGALIATLDVLADVKAVEFSEGDAKHTVTPIQFLKDLITNAKPLVQFGEFQPGRTAVVAAKGSAEGLTDAEVDAAAQTYARDHKVSYAEAVKAVSFTS